MSNQSDCCWQITFASSVNVNKELSEFLEEYFDAVACNYSNGQQEEYVGYLSRKINEDDMHKNANLLGIILPEYKIEFIPATNWLAKNSIKFSPIETKDFIIYGSHKETRPDKVAIKIYAATVFGSGQHQTTQGCLNLLGMLNEKKFHAKNILDMGCGSGILALAALKLWKKAHAIAVDIDDEAIMAAMQNAWDNKIADRLNTFQSNGYENPKISDASP
jgi:ribosomal protein L11 methyltransferase